MKIRPTFFTSLLLLTGCYATDPAVYNSPLVRGMSLVQAKTILFETTSASDDPFYPNCYRSYDAYTDIGIIAAASRKSYYIFENLSSLSNNCDVASSDGSYFTWTSTISSARRIIDNRRTQVRNQNRSTASRVDSTSSAQVRNQSRSTASQVGRNSSERHPRDPRLQKVSDVLRRLEIGSEKREAADLLDTLIGNTNPFRPNCFRLYDQPTEIEIIAAQRRAYFYVFEQVTVPSPETCDGAYENFGNGRLFAITSTLSAARNYVTEAAKTIVEAVEAQEPTQATEPRSPSPIAPLQGIRRPLR